MTWQGWFTVGTTGALVLTMAWGRLGPDLVLTGGLVVLLLAGILTPAEALSGFSNPAVATIGILFVVAAGVRETGGLDWLTHRLLGRTNSIPKAQLRMMLPVSLVSAFLNNTPVVAMMVPTISDWAKRNGLDTSKLMMPLSFAAILGGTCTLIGTSTNLVVAAMASSMQTESNIGMFDIAWIGVPCLVVGLLYTLLFSRKLLPSKQKSATEQADTQEYTVVMMLEQDSPVVGQTIEQAGLRHLPGLYLFEIDRQGEILPAVGPSTLLKANDRLVFVGIVDSVIDLRKIRGLVPDTDQIGKLQGRHPERRLFEAVVAGQSPLIGKSIRETQFRTHYNAAIIAVRRQGERIRLKVGDIVLKAGDVLLFEAHSTFLRRHRTDGNFALISEVEGSAPPQHSKAWLTTIALVAMVVASALQWISLFTAALLVVSVFVLAGCLTSHQARRALDLRILVTIGTAFGVGQALQISGAAEVIGMWMVQVATPIGPSALLAGVFAMTALLSSIITNTAAAALMFPIAATAASQTGINIVPMACIVMVAASTSFSTPIGYQTNLMVYGPGGYKFSDFLKFGLPLQILVGLIAITVAQFHWS